MSVDIQPFARRYVFWTKRLQAVFVLTIQIERWQYCLPHPNSSVTTVTLITTTVSMQLEAAHNSTRNYVPTQPFWLGPTKKDILICFGKYGFWKDLFLPNLDIIINSHRLILVCKLYGWSFTCFVWFCLWVGGLYGWAKTGPRGTPTLAKMEWGGDTGHYSALVCIGNTDTTLHGRDLCVYSAI